MPFPVSVTNTALVGVCVVGIVIATAVWVYADAKTYARRGNPIVMATESFQLRTPRGWFVACLLLWEVFFPLYIDSRSVA
jgi:hypothetical protein